MKKLLSICFMMAMMGGAMAQQSYIVKTKGVKKTTEEVSHKEAAHDETEEPKDFVGANFKHYKLCDWEKGMRFMVIPEKYDYVVGAFRDAETHKDVGCGKMRRRIMVYQGHGKNKDRESIVNFKCEDDGKNYYYPIPNSEFDDYCYTKGGVPTLAFLGDVDKARTLLMGATLYTTATSYCVDTDYDSDGFQEVSVPLNKKTKVVAIGVGTRKFPVKIIVEDEEGNQFFQNVAISKTNCGMRDEEFGMTNRKHTFYGSFRLDDKKVSDAHKYDHYIGQKYYTQYATKMTGPTGESVSMPKNSQFTIKKIMPIDNSPYVNMTLKSAKDGFEYTKRVSFTNTQVTGDIDGRREDYFDYLFKKGVVTVKHKVVKKMQRKRR